jgi:hypothetical protein
LRAVDKNAARRIVTNAENNLMHLLKSKEGVNCLKARENVHPFHAYMVRNSHMRSSLFDEDKLEQYILAQRAKYQRAWQTNASPLL